ncbi:MAG: hypothetical protein L0I24_26195 [Pseudonocardia sp.]|nr:hypothetical protein [Pseudonocardia sp.]
MTRTADHERTTLDRRLPDDEARRVAGLLRGRPGSVAYVTTERVTESGLLGLRKRETERAREQFGYWPMVSVAVTERWTVPGPGGRGGPNGCENSLVVALREARRPGPTAARLPVLARPEQPVGEVIIGVPLASPSLGGR